MFNNSSVTAAPPFATIPEENRDIFAAVGFMNKVRSGLTPKMKCSCFLAFYSLCLFYLNKHGLSRAKISLSQNKG
jgi:hypothetical protein